MSRRIKKTHELLAKLFIRVPTLKEILASPFRVTTKTVEAWARPKASTHELNNTGKGNPLDRVETLLEETHGYDPEMAREIAEHFSHFVDRLDYLAGFNEPDEDVHPCKALARVVKSNSDLILTGLGDCDDPRRISAILEKTNTLKTYVIQLEGCLRRALSNETEGENS